MSKRIVITVISLALLLPAMAAAQMSTQMQRVFDDTTRLQALLIDVSSDHQFSESVWRVVGNEANMLANRVYAGTRGWRSESAGAATELRRHVRLFRQAARAGNATVAKQHATEALPHANTIAARIRGTM